MNAALIPVARYDSYTEADDASYGIGIASLVTIKEIEGGYWLCATDHAVERVRQTIDAAIRKGLR